MLFSRFVLFAILTALISACSTVDVSQDEKYVVDPQSTDNSATVRPQANTSKAVLALLELARSAALAGEHARADSYLERASRIEPRNAVIWHYMAKLRLYQGRFAEAAGLAAKSNSLDRNNKVLQADNWRVIAHARYKKGDLAGARAAQQQADQLSQ